ncbi:MAG TPA: nuclease-related domain-containing protein [Tetragenococcus sp.]|nr:nuclease-related domain-containing protein [Tetragenococcus sp.]
MERRKSKKHQLLQTIQSRCELAQIERQELDRLEKGFQGELRMDQMVNEFLTGEIVVIDDLTLKYKGSLVQIDKIIIAGNTLYLIDMKNYRGNYILQNNNWYCGDKLLTANILEQLRRAVRLLIQLLQENQLYLKVVGVLAFVGLDGTVVVKDSVSEIILQYGDISRWLYRLNQEQTYLKYPNCEMIIRNYQVDPYSCEYRVEMADLTKGICCPKCHEIGMKEHWYKLSCSCGYTQAKLVGYLRTISEYGVIFADKDLSRKDLRLFFGEGVNDDYLRRVLIKYFELKSKAARASSYVNKGILFEYLFENQRELFVKINQRAGWKEPRSSKYEI